MSEPPEDPLPVAPFGDEAVQQVFDLWLTPEVERRRAAGRLPQPIRKAQIIFEVDGRPVVRFNDEVRVIMTVRTTRAVTKGEVVSSADFSEHISIELTDHDANGGHITLVLHQNRWWVTWDLRYNAQRISETVKAAQEFIAAAHFSGERSHARSFIDTLFSAVELLAKAELLSLPDKQLLDAKTHGSVRSRFNLWTRTGSIDRDFSGLLNTLDRMRDPARYGLQPWSLTPDEMTSLLTRAEKMLDAVASRVPRRGKVSDAGGPA